MAVFYKESIFKWNVILLPILWLCFFFLFPLFFVWILSFSEKVRIIDFELTWSFENYFRITDPIYLQIFWKSFYFSAFAMAICFLLGVPVAIMIAFSKPRYKLFLLFLCMLPFLTNLLIRTYALIAILRINGFINSLLEFFWETGNSIFSFFSLNATSVMGEQFIPLELLHNNKAVILGLVYVHLPFMILPIYAALDQLDKDFLEASYDLGAGHLRTFLFIVFPLIKKGILAAGLLTFISTLGSFLTPDLLGGADSQMIANVIDRQFKSANDFPFGAALSFILVYFTIIVLLIQEFLLRKQRRN